MQNKHEENITYEIKSSFKVTGSVDRLNAMDFLRGFARRIKMIGYSGLVVPVDELELMMMKIDGNITFKNMRLRA